MKRKILIGISSLAILYSGALWYFSSQIVSPPKGKCTQEHFLHCGDPSSLNLPFENIFITTKDISPLPGWFIPARNSHKAVIMVHGHSAWRNEGLRWAPSLHKAGFNVLLFDLRHHGENPAGPVSMGYHEYRDVIAAVDFLQNQKKMSSIGVYGVSMGGVSGIYAMARDSRIQAGVFEAAFANLEDLLGDIASRDYYLPRYPVIPMVLYLFEKRSGAKAVDINAEKIIGGISPRPVFIIHCEKDNYIPYSHGERLYQSAKEPKKFWNSPCNKHARAYQGDPATAEKLVSGFFRENLK